MQRRVFVAGGLAAVAGLVAGMMFTGMMFTGRASDAANLTLEAPSGEALAEDSGTVLVDIRTPEEWKETGVIEGALLFTYTTPEAFMSVIGPHVKEGQRLAVICRTGSRTSRATQQIAGRVSYPVVDVAGGMARVLREGYRPVTPSRAMGCAVC